MTRRIFIGPVPEDFDRTRDLAAGPWCFSGREDRHPGWENMDFVEPFDTPDKLVAAEANSAALVGKLREDWTGRLNAIHNLDRSSVFWGRYTDTWLWLAVMACWARWRYMEELVDATGPESVSVAVRTEIADWHFPDFASLMSPLLSNREFQWQIDSEIARYLAPSTWTLEGSPSQAPAAAADNSNIPCQAQSFVRRIFPRLAVDHLPGISKSKLFYSVLVSLMPRRIARPSAAAGDAAQRLPFPSSFLEFLDRFLEITVPDTIAGNAFTALDKDVSKIRFFPGRLFVANTRSPDDRNRLVSAHALLAGERLVNAQHGGWEGTAATVPWNRQTYADDHAFLTWGWHRQAGLPGRCLPHLSPALGRLRNRHRETHASLLLVGARLALNGMRFDCVPRPKQMLAYRAAKVNFLKALNPAIRGGARYRPYTRGASDLADGPHVTTKVPKVEIQTGDFDQAMLGCRLLVVDHPGTTLHRALAANTPTVCFWNEDDWPICSEAQHVFRALRDAGILYSTPEEAADFINDIWSDVPSWWNAEAVIAATSDWKRKYALTGPFWGLALAKTLWRLSRMKADQPRTASPMPKGRWYESQTNSRVVH